MASLGDATPRTAEQQQQQRLRTVDVTTGAAGFEELMLPRWLLDGLAAVGFVRPSPVQTAAIPLGRLGADLIVQAKAGTGKTLVFGTICLEKLQPEVALPQVLILAPTHEIALQSAEVLSQLAAHMPAPGAAIGVFIGGLPISEDQKLLRRRCNIAIGTPGRVCRLLEIGALVPKYIRTLVLDEADHLMSDSFLRDIRYIAKEMLPPRKQVLALSATYPPALLAELDALTEEPHHVMLCPETVSLLGVKQFFHEVSEDLEGTALLEAKVQQLLRVLSTTSFHQALVFCNSHPDAQALADRLWCLGYPASFVSGSHAQVDRMDAIAAVHEFKVRVVVATDLASRGLDLANVNLVANLDLPYDAATYMHRVGRTGRFGTHGVAIAFVTPAELQQLRGFLHYVAGGQVEPLPPVIPEELHVKPASVHNLSTEDTSQPEAQDKPSQGAGTSRSAQYGSHQMQQDAIVMDGTENQHVTASSDQLGGNALHAAAVPQQVVWTHSEGSLSSEPDEDFDDEDYAAEEFMQQECTYGPESDAEAYSEVSARFGGDAADTSEQVLPDTGNSHPLTQAGRLPYKGMAAAVLETSLWAVPAGSTSGTTPPHVALPQRQPMPQAAAALAADAAQLSAAESALTASGAPQMLPPPPPPEQQVGSEAEGILGPPDLLVRYYQLEAFAAEYYAWFCRTQQHRQGSL